MAASVDPNIVVSATGRGHLRLVRDDVSGLLAHDLKSPLAAIAMNLDYALGELGAETRLARRARGARGLPRLEPARRDHRRGHGRRSAPRLGSAAGDPRAGRRAGAARGVGPEARRGRGVARGAAPLGGGADDHPGRREPPRPRARTAPRAGPAARARRTAPSTSRSGAGASSSGSTAEPDGGRSARPIPMRRCSSLAIHFADAAMRAQGGAVWTEGDADGGAALRRDASLP